MEIEGLRQRSASQGSLNSSYRAHGKFNGNTYPRLPMQRRPLRSVKETSSMLRSPGPLESMLKTTTETGDIGIFSIKPIPPSMTYHHPPRSRPAFGDESLRMRPRSRNEDAEPRDDRRRLPSYRDTTSEIISLYESGTSTRPSYPSSFAPSLDEGGRSYSMTTCDSRQIPSYQSSCTLQSSSSNNAAQRPRSPYPYPTRLRRPGVRPASPAITEGGVVDYSRMVEVDRVSYVGGLFNQHNT